VATVPPSVTALVDSIRADSGVESVAWAVYLAALVIWIARILTRRSRELLPIGRLFQPFSTIDELRAWPRDEPLRLIEERIGNTEGPIPIIVGPSGAGKTVILKRLLPERLGLTSAKYLYFDEYIDFFTVIRQIAEQADRGSTGRPDIIVLDQFEQLVAQLNAKPSNERIDRWSELRGYITQLRADNIDVLISVRFEWFYELRPLGEIVPSPSKCIHVAGPSIQNMRDSTFSALSDQMDGVLGGDVQLRRLVLDQLGSDGTILLVEAQIVGSALEALRLKGIRLGRDQFLKLGGVGGSIDLYFDEMLAGAPDRRIALKVMAALSTTTQFRRQEDLTNVYDVLFEDEDEIAQAIAYLRERGVVIDRGGWGQLELAHDYVAEYFHARCGHELRPTDRDNVIYHLEVGPANMGPEVLSRQQRSTQTGTLGWTVFGILFLLMTTRLIGFGLPWTIVGSFKPQYSFDGRFFDATYVPIFLAHGAWVIYITLFYVRLLTMLNEHGWAKIHTYLVPIFMGACVVTAAFIPYCWMFTIGCGGVFLGGKLIGLAASSNLAAGAKARMREFGRTTAAAMAFLTVLGAGGAWASFALQGRPGFSSHWLAISMFAALTMTVPCLTLAPYHIQRPAVAEFLGLLARSPRSSGARTVLPEAL